MRRNKQTFFGILIFFILFLQQAADSNSKKDSKNEHSNKQLFTIIRPIFHWLWKVHYFFFIQTQSSDFFNWIIFPCLSTLTKKGNFCFKAIFMISGVLASLWKTFSKFSWPRDKFFITIYRWYLQTIFTTHSITNFKQNEVIKVTPRLLPFCGRAAKLERFNQASQCTLVL